jgi:hypothetical protein
VLLAHGPGRASKEAECQTSSARLGESDVYETEGEKAGVVGGHALGEKSQSHLTHQKQHREDEQHLLRASIPAEKQEAEVHCRQPGDDEDDGPVRLESEVESRRGARDEDTEGRDHAGTDPDVAIPGLKASDSGA